MIIQYMSDLHLEFTGNQDFMPTPMEGVKVLVLAGDIGVGDAHSEWMKEVCKLFPNVVYVLGNHEYYHHEYHETATTWQWLGSEIPNLHVLENQTVEIEGALFAGCTLWTNFAHDRKYKDLAENGMNDYRIIRLKKGLLRAEDTARFNSESVYWLENLKRRPGIIVTHHLPSWRSVPARFAADPLSHAYASHLDDTVEHIGPKLWIHGHSHDRQEYKLGKTLVVSNPMGYPHEYGAGGWDPGAHVHYEVSRRP